MSQYNVTLRKATLADADRAADLAWAYGPWNREQFEWLKYRDLIRQEVIGGDAIICEYQGLLVGALCVSDFAEDMLIPGYGVYVAHKITNPGHPRVLRMMLRTLRTALRKAGASWYNTTRRESAHVCTSRYWRLHEQSA